MMSYVALLLAACSFIISIVTLISLLIMARRRRRIQAPSPWSDELLTRDAWLEEIEARGEAVLARIEEAESRLRFAGTSASPRHEWAMGATIKASVPATGQDFVSAAGETLRAAGPDSSTDSSTETVDHAKVQVEVRRLAAQGHDVTAIARRLQLGRGEVELFLDLTRRPNDG